MNKLLESISKDLGFAGNALEEGTGCLQIVWIFRHLIFDWSVLRISANNDWILGLNAGLVTSMCLGGAFMECLFSGWIADSFGHCGSFQFIALPNNWRFYKVI